MPTVPVYRSHVTLGRAPDTRMGVRATPDQFGAAIGEGVAALGRGVATASSVADKMAAEERAKANSLAVLEAKNALERKLSPKLAQARLARGKDAIATGEKLLPDYDTIAEEIAGGLADEDQRTAFRGYAIGRRTDIQTGLDAQAAAGLKEWEDSQFKANGEVLSNRIADAYQDPSRVALAVAERVKEIAGYADRNNLPPEWRQAAIRATQSQAARQVITAHMDAGNDLAAAKTLEQYKPFLTAEDASAAARLVEVGSSKNEAIRQGMAIYEPGMALEDMFAKADQIQNPRVRDETKRWLDEKNTLARRAREEDQDRLVQGIYDEAKKSPLGLRVIPESRLQLLDADKRERLEGIFAREAKGEAIPWQQSKAVRYQIEARLADPTARAELLRRGPAAFLGTMNEDDQNAVAGVIADMRKGNDIGWLNTREDLVNQAAASIGLDPRPYHTDKGKVVHNPAAVQFRAAVEREASALATEGKRDKPNREDIQKAVDAVTARTVKINRWGTDPDKVAAVVTADERGRAYVPIESVPANNRAGILGEIQDTTGKPGDDDRVQRAYAAALMGDRALYDRIIAGQD